jgi:hypothetical protein
VSLLPTMLILLCLLYGIIIYLICAAAGRADAARAKAEQEPLLHPSHGAKGAEDDRAQGG